jgi:polyhydroxyalkanoate synthase
MNEFNDADKIINNLKQIGEKYQEAMLRIMQDNNMPTQFINALNQQKMQSIMTEASNKIMEHPEQFIQHNIEYGQRLTTLLNNTMMRFVGEQDLPIYDNNKDRRFKHPSWHENLYFDFIRQFYLMSTEWLQESTSQISLEPKMQQILEFYTRQFTDAFCPSNFPLYNPEVINESLASKWDNISKGLDNFLEDLKNGHGILDITTTDKMAFKIGKNIASTPGKVVMQNDLMQLIYYEPKKKVHQIPILIIPPWINKYYILDLSPENSLVKWLVDNNFQVFLISWINPDKKLAHKSFEDYASDGIIAASEYITRTLGVPQINAIGYCIGGTLLACALSVMKSKKMDYIASSTYLATLLDFSNAGEVGLFINEDTIALIEQEMSDKGFFDGKYLAGGFSLLRANDLIWSFFISNYLLGKRPLPFDLLYWNSDPTNLPEAMHSFYLRNMYLENNLTKSCKVTMLQEKIDLSSVNIPCFFLAAKDDHITPWRGVYNSMQLLGGEKEFCLTASGHVAGIINPVNQKKYSFWAGSVAESHAKWRASAKESAGSWWPHWLKWQLKYSGDMIEEKSYSKAKAIEAAPGSYVKQTII